MSTSKAPPKSQKTSGASRRSIVASGLTAAAIASVGGSASAGEAVAAKPARTLENPSSLSFREIPHGMDASHAVSPGHSVQVLLRWGDPIVAGAPAWTPQGQNAAAQAVQFGYDNDYIAFHPLPYGSNSSERGLLCVNHESARNHLMFPGFTSHQRDELDRRLVDIEMMALGHSIVEVARKGELWGIETGSRYNRRITAMTEIDIAGPAAGHNRMKTHDDPTGRLVLGTLGNCAGGVTPWGTVLTAEENIHQFFAGDPRGTVEAANHLTMGISVERLYGWGAHYARFNVQAEPNEPNRFGWIVEIDPYSPTARPIKRTALGRFKHEAAGVVVNPDGRLVVYMGDDEAFQYIYKFVSHRLVKAADRYANLNLLDYGTLYVAKFNDDDQTVNWLPVIWGNGPLTVANGFANQGDVMIDTRRAAKLLGATPMDRPEDIDVNPVTGTVFVALTKNTRRTAENVDGANPRAKNVAGHIIEIIPSIDHAAPIARWQVFLKAGDPGTRDAKTQYNPATSDNGWFCNPDNLAFDPKGRMWIGTDGANDFGYGDGIWATDVVGNGRALTRHFFRCPVGAELTGPAFTPDGTTLFCSVQHPGDDGKSSFVDPITRWPDFKDGIPPRPSVIAIRAASGKPIG